MRQGLRWRSTSLATTQYRISRKTAKSLRCLTKECSPSVFVVVSTQLLLPEMEVLKEY